MNTILQFASANAYPIAASACLALNIGIVSKTEHPKRNILALIASVSAAAFSAYTLFRAYGPNNGLAAQFTLDLVSKVFVQLTLMCMPLIAFSKLSEENLKKIGIGGAIAAGGALMYSLGSLGAEKTAQIAGKLFLHLGIAPIIGGTIAAVAILSVAGAAQHS